MRSPLRGGQFHDKQWASVGNHSQDWQPHPFCRRSKPRGTELRCREIHDHVASPVPKLPQSNPRMSVPLRMRVRTHTGALGHLEFLAAL